MAAEEYYRPSKYVPYNRDTLDLIRQNQMTSLSQLDRQMELENRRSDALRGDIGEIGKNISSGIEKGQARKAEREKQDYTRKMDERKLASEEAIAKDQAAFRQQQSMQLTQDMAAKKQEMDYLNQEVAPGVTRRQREDDIKNQKTLADIADLKAKPAAAAAIKAEDRAYKEEQAKKISDEKKMASLNEIEDRRTNIIQNLDIVDKMVEDKGTWEAFGSHNQDLERLVDSIATDMAKLQDPTSVARPAEVDMIKNNLVKSGFKNSNATAQQILKNFKEEVHKRADNAYKIRGIAKPNGSVRLKNPRTGEVVEVPVGMEGGPKNEGFEVIQ